MKKMFRKKMFKAITDMFQTVIEEDFNPDIVQISLADSYESGLVKGIAIGAGVSILASATVFAVSKICKRKEKRDEICSDNER